MEGHIYIYGYISGYQDDEPGVWGEVNLKDVQAQIQSQPAAKSLVVHINSGGGDVDEGFAIHDVLKATGKKIITQVEGMCASIATVISLAGEERFMTTNSEFMIHCPMMWGGGTADDLQKQATELLKVEDKVLDFYVQKTGSDREAIKAMMKDETWLTSDQAKELGFITDVMVTMKAVARINLKNHKMAQITAADIDKAFEDKAPGIIEKVMKKLGFSKAKMITITAADGTILDFGEDIQEESQIVEGTTATVDGTPASGDYVLTDGRTLVFTDGAVTEIKEAEAEESVEDLKAQIAAKDTEIANLKATSAKAEKARVKMEAKMEAKLQKRLEKSMKAMKATLKSDLGFEDKDEKDEGRGKKGDRHLKK